jgi:1-acyl-sn-glycerol-3-phosphate acyltransferase
VLLVVALGLSMASVFGVFERLGMATPWNAVSAGRGSSWRAEQCPALRRDGARRTAEQPMLWVSNHVSWTDIPLLGMLTPLSFLSKAEVRTWPVAGWLAAKAGSLFIRRGGRQPVDPQTDDPPSGAAHPLLMFPEGTTTDGRSCAPSTGACWPARSIRMCRCNRWRFVICAMVRSTVGTVHWR